MPFARPTLTELRTDVAADISAELSGAATLPRYSNLGIMGDIQASLANGLYGYLDYIAKQSVPFTATDEYLEGWAALKSVIRKPATAASGVIAMAAADDAVVPEGTPISRFDGAAYISTAEATAAGGSVQIPAIALVPGAAGDTAAGLGMTLGTAIAGVQSSGVVSTVFAGGADIEPDDELRSRMLEVYASPPQGGSRTDYPEWALQVPGVTRCWVYPSAMGPGTIVLLFMMDDAEAAHGGFPQGSDGVASAETRDTAATGDQLILANAIFALQPVTALVYAVSPTANELGFTIAGIPGASTATKAAIATAIANALRLNAVPGGVTNISTIEAAIAAVAGTAGFVITGITASAGAITPGAAGNITSNAGALPVFGSAAYV